MAGWEVGSLSEVPYCPQVSEAAGPSGVTSCRDPAWPEGNHRPDVVFPGCRLGDAIAGFLESQIRVRDRSDNYPLHDS